MTKKQKSSPKVKHKAFASFSVKLQDNDWMIGIFNPNDKTAAYFLAEPTLPNKTEYQHKAPANKHTGYLVSALSRQGLTESLFRGLPRKFKDVEDAMEWLESQIDQYDGDKALPVEDVVTVLPPRTLSDTGEMSPAVRISGETNEQYEAEPVYVDIKPEIEATVKGKVFLKHKTASDAARAKKAKTDAELEKKLSKTGKEIKPQGPNGAKSTKTANSDGPYVKPASKFKTSKEELKSLGLDGLFDD